MMSEEDLIDEIQDEMQTELSAEIHGKADKNILELKIKGAYRDVKHRRNYQNHHTQDFINKDMESMFSLIKYLALYDWNLMGADGQTNMSENGISRTWRSRDEILTQVVPFVTVL